MAKKNWNDNEEYMDLISDLISNEEVLKLRNFVHHHYTDRLEHSIAVSYKSYLIAKKMGLDYKSVARAGLLHDFFLMTSKEVAGLGCGSHNNHHPRIALENAKKITTINKIEEDIILKHMFAVALVSLPKYKESYIVSMIDKYVSLEDVFNPLGRLVKQKVVMTAIMSMIILTK